MFLDEDLCPKIADFGLAKLSHLKDSALSMAEVRGTIGFLAPEVFSRVLESCPLNRMFTATG